MLKNMSIRESKTLEFRAELFNAFNHAPFNAPDGNINNSTFGVLTSAQPTRIGRRAAKFMFELCRPSEMVDQAGWRYARRLVKRRSQWFEET